MAKMTWKSKSDLLQEAKESRKQSLSMSCQGCILSGFECTIKGTEYHFSYDKEAQANFSERWQLFQNDMIEEIKVTAHTDSEDVRLTFNKDSFNQLYLSSVMHKENCISKYRDNLLPLVDLAMTIEQVEAITWEAEVVEPEPSIVLVEDDNTLEKQVDGIKISHAQSNAEIVQLIMMR